MQFDILAIWVKVGAFGKREQNFDSRSPKLKRERRLLDESVWERPVLRALAESKPNATCGNPTAVDPEKHLC